MFEHSDFAAPPDDTVVWRYVGLPTLLAMLSKRTLHFTRLDTYKDKWEGVWPDANRKQILECNPPDLAEWILKHSELLRTHAHVNCWHKNTDQSAALWEQYGQSTGLAIKTTVLALRESIRPRDGVFIGTVEYVDYQAIEQAFHVRDPLKQEYLKPVFLKRKSFAHENEVRLLKWFSPKANANGEVAEPDTKCGCDIDVDLERLIGAVYLSPTTDRWLFPHVKRLFEVFGLEGVEILRSKLYDPHTY
jgi:hypothetical protein